MQKICLIAWIAAAALITGCAAPRVSTVPPDVLAGWNVAADCLRVKQKAGEIAGKPVVGDTGSRDPVGVQRDAETRFLTAEYTNHPPSGSFGQAGFKDGWFAACRQHIGDR